MQFAIAIPTDADSWRVVRRAEELGFARAWFYDTQMLSADPFVAMAAAALKTTKIRLGTGCADPVEPHRSPVARANAFASLNKLAPGRIDFGIGTGFTGRRAMGLGAVKLADHGGVCPGRHGAAARGDRRGRNRKQEAADPAAEPRARADQHARSDLALPRGLGSPSARLDREARGRLDRHGRRCGGRDRCDGRHAGAPAGRRSRGRGARCGRADRRRDLGRGRARRLAARRRAGRATRRNAVAPRGRRRTGGVADDGAAAARSSQRPWRAMSSWPANSRRRAPIISKTTAAI